MKFSTGLAAGLGAIGAVASPVEKRNPEGVDYVQNYNGGAANFQNNLGAGTFSAQWNGNTDIVVGIGWQTGKAR